MSHNEAPDSQTRTTGSKVKCRNRRQTDRVATINHSNQTEIRDFFGQDSPILWYPGISRKRTLTETAFCIEEADIEPPNRVLDLACGFGRHAIELAMRGYEVTAVDQSEALITEGRRRARQNGLSIEFEVSRATTFTVKNKFDCVLSLWTGLGYQSRAEDRGFLHTMRNALTSDGRAILDITNRHHALGSRPNIQTGMSPEGPFTLTRRILDSEIEVEEILSIETLQQTRSWVLRQHLYSWDEAHALVRASGFRVIAEYGGFDRSGPSRESPRIILVMA